MEYTNMLAEAKREISDKMNGIIPLKDYTDQ